jgi:hypothetical protein
MIRALWLLASLTDMRRGRAIADLPSIRSCHQGELLPSATATLGAALEACA